LTASLAALSTIFSFFPSFDFFPASSPFFPAAAAPPAPDSPLACLLSLPFPLLSFPLLLSFFSFKYCTNGVVVTFSPLTNPSILEPASSSFDGTELPGFASDSRKSINSGSRSMVPWRASARFLSEGTRVYGENSTVGGPKRVGLLAESSSGRLRMWLES
jgi:hypothetical protein